MIQYSVQDALSGVRRLLDDVAGTADDEFLRGQALVAVELLDNLLPRLAWADEVEVFRKSEVYALLADVVARSNEDVPETVSAALAGDGEPRIALPAALSDARRWAHAHGHADLDTRARTLISAQLDDELALLRRPSGGGA